jgi:acyl-CoA thioester hydrolase
VSGRFGAPVSTERDDYGYRHLVRTRFAETDAMAVVHHASYVLYMEEARVAFLSDAGHPYRVMRADGVEFPVTGLWCGYRRPLQFDDLVEVAVRVGALGRAAFRMDYLLSVERTIHAIGWTEHAATRDGRPVRLPEWIGTLAGPRRDEDASPA